VGSHGEDLVVDIFRADVCCYLRPFIGRRGHGAVSNLVEGEACAPCREKRGSSPAVGERRCVVCAHKMEDPAEDRRTSGGAHRWLGPGDVDRSSALQVEQIGGVDHAAE
jgi:hypothetical protein